MQTVAASDAHGHLEATVDVTESGDTSKLCSCGLMMLTVFGLLVDSSSDVACEEEALPLTALNPFEAWLWTISRTRGPFAPLCCISAEEDIVSSLSVVLKMSEVSTPIIGLSLSHVEGSLGPVCRILFAWVERDDDTDTVSTFFVVEVLSVMGSRDYGSQFTMSRRGCMVP